MPEADGWGKWGKNGQENEERMVTGYTFSVIRQIKSENLIYSMMTTVNTVSYSWIFLRDKAGQHHHHKAFYKEYRR